MHVFEKTDRIESVVKSEKTYTGNIWLISHVNIGHPLGGHSVIVLEGYIDEKDCNDELFKQRFKPKKAATTEAENVTPETENVTPLNPGPFVGQFDLIATLPKSNSWLNYIPFYGTTQKVTGERTVEIRDFMSNKTAKTRSYTNKTSATWTTTKDAVKAVIKSIHLDMDRVAEIEFFIFGKDSIYGKGGHNCVTWAESKLAIAGAGNAHVSADSSSASPEVHIRTSQP